MNEWVIVVSFTFPHEAHLARGKLESEDIPVLIRDELTVQVNHFYSNAIGGVKLLVRPEDYDKAYQLLIDAEYIRERKISPNRFLVHFNKITSQIPLIGNLLLEARLIIFIAFSLGIIATMALILFTPSIQEKLTKHQWCVDKMYYKGQEVVPYSYGGKLYGGSENCHGTMSFGNDGIVQFPGISSFGDRARWEFRNDSLMISEWQDNWNFTINDSLQIMETKDSLSTSIYLGTYFLEIDDNWIEMRSDNLVILGKVYHAN